MTQEEKLLLFKVLCGMLPYEVKIQIYNDYLGTMKDEKLNVYHLSGAYDIEYRKLRPYLRPISSMTEFEMDKLFDILHIDKDGNDEDWIKINDVLGIKFFFPTGKWVEDVAEAYDYLNSIHIDYRGLIEKGLALKAKEGMYKTK